MREILGGERTPQARHRMVAPHQHHPFERIKAQSVHVRCHVHVRDDGKVGASGENGLVGVLVLWHCTQLTPLAECFIIIVEETAGLLARAAAQKAAKSAVVRKRMMCFSINGLNVLCTRLSKGCRRAVCDSFYRRALMSLMAFSAASRPEVRAKDEAEPSALRS